ncbi:hypothetical protein [Solimonas marina]|uniref:Lipoprotein n=1 Tax=Solimonas marina TaxID=2714601 RepID=A0A969WAD5_9GAMM|nr:hypothetical protein [Solimonas marina]NKF23726.1 hypothetical protein [Solimonas marina]
MIKYAVALIGALACGAAQADVGVSVSVGQPGFYGQINVGNMPAPQLVYPQAVIVQRVAAPPPPVYLHVPPGHEKHWSQHCAQYHACGRPVYFVQDNWYNSVYVPDYQRRHGPPGHDRHDEGHGHGHGHDHH